MLSSDGTEPRDISAHHSSGSRVRATRRARWTRVQAGCTRSPYPTPSPGPKRRREAKQTSAIVTTDAFGHSSPGARRIARRDGNKRPKSAYGSHLLQGSKAALASPSGSEHHQRPVQQLPVELSDSIPDRALGRRLGSLGPRCRIMPRSSTAPGGARTWPEGSACKGIVSGWRGRTPSSSEATPGNATSIRTLPSADVLGFAEP